MFDIGVILLLFLAVGTLFLRTTSLNSKCSELQLQMEKLQCEIETLKNSQHQLKPTIETKPKRKRSRSNRSNTNTNKELEVPVKVTPPTVEEPNISIPHVFLRMSSSQSLPVVNDNIKLRNSFIGHQAVSWLTRNLELPRDCAVSVCQKMIDENYIEVVEGTPGKFEDKTDVYYKFITQSNNSSNSELLEKLSGDLKVGLTEGIEGYISIFTENKWTKYYISQDETNLILYNKPITEQGKRLVEIHLSDCTINSVNSENYEFQLSSKINCNIFQNPRRVRKKIKKKNLDIFFSFNQLKF